MIKIRHIILAAAFFLSACAPTPTVDESRQSLWQQFGGHSVDELLLKWGAPQGESRLTDGSRLLTYRRATVYDPSSAYANTSGCAASFLAKPPDYKIANVSMDGNMYDCQDLALGKVGVSAAPIQPTTSFGLGFYSFH
jgi:hypothetical protein